MEKAKQFFKKEPVFVIAAVCAVASMFAVPPSADYLGYIDLRVLELLFCLMAAVAGMQAEGSFLVLSQRLLTGKKSMRLLTMTLVMLPFFSSMLITNDVSLITFVPFAVLVLELTGRPEKVDAFLKILADYKILEQCRTGVTALERGGMHQHMQKPPQEVRAAQLPLPGTHCPQ